MLDPQAALPQWCTGKMSALTAADLPSSSSVFPPISLQFTVLILHLLCSQLYLCSSPFFFFFFCVPTYISAVHHSYSSSSVFPPISLQFTILLLLRSQLYLWGSPFFSFFCVPRYNSAVHHSSSPVFPAISLRFTSFLLLLCSQL